MQINKNISLRNYNTFNIKANAKYFTTVKYADELTELSHSDIFRDNKHIILGGGSNILFVNDYDGLVVKNEIKGMKFVKSTDDEIWLEVGAGEVWEDFVKLCVRNNFGGIENLAAIPGTCGAAPVQNIGAYSVEQKDVFEELKGFSIENKSFEKLNNEQCRFGYRSSIFKNELKNKFIVSSVVYRLSLKPVLNLNYKELFDIIDKCPEDKLNLEYVCQTVTAIRNRKLPNPKELGNAGSFFKNPVVESQVFNNLQRTFPNIPHYIQANEKVKIPAAWLIEQCNWKGKRISDAGVYEKHSLILVNHNQASGIEILDLANKIKESVINKFGIELEFEVNIIE